MRKLSLTPLFCWVKLTGVLAEKDATEKHLKEEIRSLKEQYRQAELLRLQEEEKNRELAIQLQESKEEASRKVTERDLKVFP